MVGVGRMKQVFTKLTFGVSKKKTKKHGHFANMQSRSRRVLGVSPMGQGEGA